MLTLHDYLPSQNGWKIRVLLGLLEIPNDHCHVSIFEGESHTQAFLSLNPAGAIPCSGWRTDAHRRIKCDPRLSRRGHSLPASGSL